MADTNFLFSILISDEREGYNVAWELRDNDYEYGRFEMIKKAEYLTLDIPVGAEIRLRAFGEDRRMIKEVVYKKVQPMKMVKVA